MDRAGVMELKTVVKYLNMQLDGRCKSNQFYCVIAATMDEYKKTRALIGVCWHDNRELEDAIVARIRRLSCSRPPGSEPWRGSGRMACVFMCVSTFILDSLLPVAPVGTTGTGTT